MKRMLEAMPISIEKLYSYGRYKIIDKEILQTMEQYFPDQGKILDIGSGFGLFANYFAMGHSVRHISGFDKNKKRIDYSKAVAKRLNIKNVHFFVEDALHYSFTQNFDGIYMLDIIHHLPAEEILPLLKNIFSALNRDGVLLIKDIDTFPVSKMLFALFMDKMLSPKDEVHYWPSEKFLNMLRSVGFRVFRHSINDILPYSHVLYICYKSHRGI